MIIDVIDKKVILNIPSTHKKIKKNVLRNMIDLGIFDDVDNFKGDEVIINDNDLETLPTKTIGIWVSGGADSSILLYCLTKKIKEEKLDVKIQPLSVRRGRPWNPLYAENVVDFIRNELDVKFVNDIIVYYPDINDEYQRENKEFRERDVENFNSRIIDIMYSGITMNPPNDSGLPKNKERTRDQESDRPIELENEFVYYINPFFDIHKKHIAEIYKKFGLLDSLFPITRSCEGFEHDTGCFTYHCGKCWWCYEREWAFGRLQ